MSIGNNIRKIRESRNISIDEMVKKISIFKAVYIGIEKGLIKPKKSIVLKISKVFNLSEKDIVNYKEGLINNEIVRLNLKNLKDVISTIDIAVVPKKIEVILTPISKTPINVVLEDLSVKEVIYKRPVLLTSSDLFQIGDKIKTVGVKDVLPNEKFIDTFGELDPNLIVDENRSFSSRLLNWTEPFVINGVEKTLFYTEINTGLKLGDRVFIINGNYDSNRFIQENKYKGKVDGHKVLFTDNCKIVLDIDYQENKLPFIDEPIDNFINIYYIERIGDFRQANRQVTSRGGIFNYKFSENQNNVAFFNSLFPVISDDWGGTTQSIEQRGFYIKDDSNKWVNISNNIMSGSFSSALSEIYDNNGKIRIHNGSFTFSVENSVVSFSEGLVYEWKISNELDGVSGTASSWIVNNLYNTPFISKSNFRKGDFNGIFNSGIFGTQDNRIIWDNSTFEKATWNTGVLLNTNWISGEMRSINALSESYESEFDENGIPYQRLNAPNNNDRGFNYVENSEFVSIEVDNGIFNSSNIGQGVTYSIMEQHVTGSTDSSIYNFTVNKAQLDNCKIVGGLIKNSDINNSRVLNTKLENIKSINSNYKLSIIKDSIYISDDIIKILDYDEFTLAEKLSNSEHSHKIYKFYINEDDYKKLKIRDRFYIKGLTILDNSKYPLNFFDRRFRLSSWTEYFDSYQNNQFIKRGVEVGAFLSTPGDNEWKLNYTIHPIKKTVVTEENQNKNYSLDIVVSTFDKDNNQFTNDSFTNELPINGLTINKSLQSSIEINELYPEPMFLGNNVDVSNAYIANSDFESGIIENTDWVSGNHINYNNDVNIVDNNFGTYSIIAITQSSQLVVKTGYDSSYKEAGDDCLEVGNIVFLGNIEYQPPNGNIINLGDTYKIVNTFNNLNELILEEIGTNTIVSITQSDGTFSTQNAQNRYNYIYKAKIDKSKISSGIFRRSYITGSFIENETFDISDKDFNNLNNIKKLVISDSIFKNNQNILSKALYMNTSFVDGDDKFENGIVFNSIWNGLTFSRGVFKESRWESGVFNSGLFYNNRSFDGVTSSIAPMYNDERIKSYYKDGITSATISNNRYSWQNGDFFDGDFFESDWENGNFNSGKFYYSKFYDGVINGGFIGDYKTPLTNTLVYNATINFTTVNNAALFASDNSSGSNSSIIWRDGIFNNGEFGSRTNHIAIWENGSFNSGNFENMAIWKNGIFNGGRFLSTYGWTMSDSSLQSDYTWQDGQFNGGEFGNANGASNSTWFTGEFNDGKFVGRVWNNGIFTNGDFIGSATYSAVRGVTATQSNALLFTDSFTSSYYGFWRDGVVSDKKDDFIKDRNIILSVIRSKSRIRNSSVVLANTLWSGGTFSHSSGSMQNSVWLNGIFEKGKFLNSSFNPYVNRNESIQPHFELSDSCRWENGDLIDSDFYISKWEKGKFDTGDAYGMIWRDGVCNYMNAFNIFWEGGLWRNGNWYGSYMDYNGTIENDFYKQILLRGASWSGTQSMHLWNIFNDSPLATEFVSDSASEPF